MSEAVVNRVELRHCRDLRVLFATGCGTGFAPGAPGTAGSLAALVIWWFALSFLALPVAAVVLAVLVVVGIACVRVACRVADVGDDQRIVLDEWLGMWVALFGCPRQLAPAALAFLLFRLFDILKPWPVSWADRRVGGGLGVVLDDLIAGGLAAIVLQLSFVLFHTIRG